MEKKQRVKKFNWNQFKKYVETYEPAKHADNNAEVIFQDMLYGIGIAVDRKKYSWADGFRRFKEYISKSEVV